MPEQKRTKQNQIFFSSNFPVPRSQVLLRCLKPRFIGGLIFRKPIGSQTGVQVLNIRADRVLTQSTSKYVVQNNNIIEIIKNCRHELVLRTYITACGLVVPVLDMSWKCPVLVPVSLFLGQNPYLSGHRFHPNNR